LTEYEKDFNKYSSSCVRKLIEFGFEEAPDDIESPLLIAEDSQTILE